MLFIKIVPQETLVGGRILHAVTLITTVVATHGDFKGSSQLIGSKASWDLNVCVIQCTKLKFASWKKNLQSDLSDYLVIKQ